MAKAPSPVDWNAWWEVAEVVYAIRSFATEPDYDAALGEYRSRVAGRKKSEKRMTAKQFDTAVKGAHASMAGHQETITSALTRARWMLGQRMRPIFARPLHWEWAPPELDLIAEARLRYVEPKFLSYSRVKISEARGPDTEGRRLNPWQMIKAR